MSAVFLLDTNVLSEAAAARPDPGVLRRLSEHRHQLATASLVVHELAFGAARLPRSRRRRELEHFLDRVVLPSMPILPYDLQAALWHAAERARLAAAGAPPPFVDGQLAAIAAANGLTLVTRNLRDFAAFEGLDCVSWHRE